MKTKLKQFLIDEFGITLEQLFKMTPEEVNDLVDKLNEIDADEAYKSESITERWLLATKWRDLLTVGVE